MSSSDRDRSRRTSEKRKRSPGPEAQEQAPVFTPWVPLMSLAAFASADQKLHHEILAYAAYVRLTLQEQRARDALFAMLQKTLRRIFSGGELKLHGSATTGLCLPAGDMDIVLLTGEEIPSADKKRTLFRISGLLKSAQIADDVQVNFRARVPIVKFTSRPEFGSLSVDIGLNNTDGLRAIEIVNGYLSKMPALRPLILVVKGFLVERDLNNPAHGGLGSYAVTCMCISFLQLNPSKRPQEYIDSPMESESLGSLLTDFMFYYGLEFPYATSYISVSEGKLLPKASAEWITNTMPNGLAIQCLINPENDVSKATSRIDAIRRAFKTAYSAILKLSPEDASVLGPLVSFKQSVLDHRAHIEQLVDSDRLAGATAAPPTQPSNHDKQQRPRKPPALESTPTSGRVFLGLPARPPPEMQPPTQPTPRYAPYGAESATHGASSSAGGRGVSRRGSGVPSGMRSDALLRMRAMPAAPSSYERFDPEWPPRGRGAGGANLVKGKGGESAHKAQSGKEKGKGDSGKRRKVGSRERW